MTLVRTVPSGAKSDAPTSDAAELAAALLAIDPRGLGGVVLDHPMHESARAFCTALQRLMPTGAPQRRIPAGVTADRLLGGVDLAATLRTGTLVGERGILALADGGFVVVPMAERAALAVRTSLSDTLDQGVIRLAREGITDVYDARIAVVLFDESVDDESVHDAFVDRLAFRVRLDATNTPDRLAEFAARVSARARYARDLVTQTVLSEEWLVALCEAGDAYGVASSRATTMAVRCARAHAALCGRLVVGQHDVEIAAALVLAPRATRLPPEPEEAADAPPPSAAGEDAPSAPPPDAANAGADAPPPQAQAEAPSPETDAQDDQADVGPGMASEIVRNAIAVALPPDLLTALIARLDAASTSGRAGAETASTLRGRPRGSTRGLPRGGARLHLLETLRAAAPWQRSRARERERDRDRAASAATPRLAIRRDDFRIRRFIERTGTTVLFVVDASGSSALQRLNEAKGAVELLLAESYARRDRVALIAFRGTSAEVMLPPTRALARARRALAAMPGGGGTPLANAIELATTQAIAARRTGSAPLVVLLTDGRANIARDGTPGRADAERDALAAARAFALVSVPSLFVDTSPRGEPCAKRVAAAMGARYVLLPSPEAGALGALVRTAVSLAEQ